MELGMLTSEISRPNFKDLLKTVRDYGFTQIQLDLASVIKVTMPEHIDIAWAQNIADEAAQQGIKIVAVNGTFNSLQLRMCFLEKAVGPGSNSERFRQLFRFVSRL